MEGCIPCYGQERFTIIKISNRSKYFSPRGTQANFKIYIEG